MKKTLFVLSVATLAAGTAAAQSSVTLFGIVDTSARYVKNGSAGSQKQLASGGLNTSRFGFRGSEDLGSGLSAAFWLEAGINPDTGTTDAKFFGRRSTVSLIGSFGEIRLGRDYNPTAVNTFNEPFGLVGVGSVGGAFTYGPGSDLGSGATTVLRNDNSIGYFLPANLGGIYGSAMVAAGEGTPGNKYLGARVGFAGGPVDVGVAYGKTKTATNTDYNQYNAKAIYNFGPVKLNGLYDVKKFGSLSQKMALVGVTVPLGSGELRAAYAINNRSGGVAGSAFANDADSKLMALGYYYNMSKRTALYTTVARITNKGAARGSVSGAPPAGMLGGQTSSGVEAGVSHKF